MGESLNSSDTVQAEIESLLHITCTETDGLPLIDSQPLAQVIDSVPDATIAPTTDIQGVAGDITYTLSLPERPGSHNTTYVATLHGQHDTQFVLKRGPDITQQAQRYAQWLAQYPLIGDYTARIYGSTPSGWIAIEYLSGLSYGQIAREMRQDSAFIETYAAAAYQSIDTITSAGLELADVSFGDGHNIVLDTNSESRRIRFLEHANIRPATLNLQPEEISFQILCREITAATRPGEQTEPERLRFIFTLAQQAFATHDPESYYLRPMRRQQSQQAGAPAGYISIAPSSFVIPTRLQQLYAGYSFSPDFVACTQAGEFDTFCQLVLNGQHIAILPNEDPRAQPNTIA